MWLCARRMLCLQESFIIKTLKKILNRCLQRHQFLFSSSDHVLTCSHTFVAQDEFASAEKQPVFGHRLGVVCADLASSFFAEGVEHAILVVCELIGVQRCERAHSCGTQICKKKKNLFHFSFLAHTHQKQYS